VSDQVILRVAAKIVVPTILLFALYVQFHGDFGPGGGFQAGVILSTGFILYGLVFGLSRSQQVLPSGLTRSLASLGVLLYAGVGVGSILRGGEFLNFNVLAHEPHRGQHLGIMLVEFGVMITVFGVMVTIFYFFAARGRESA
jgi:multicomponent Na+:H+ antiporter subunit B